MGQPKKSNDDGPDPFAAALRECLAVRGMTYAELARKIGRSASAMSNYTAGRDTPSPAAVFAMEAALGLTAGTLARHLGFGPVDPGPLPGVPEAILADRRLAAEDKALFLGLYNSLAGRSDR